MSLSTLIVQREIATIREVEEALARQVLYGGDLVTNLLEVCRVDEGKLGPVLGDAFGLAPAPSGELPSPSPEARKLIAAQVLAERNLLPLALDNHGLLVAVAEPLPRDVEQDLVFALALPIAQRIVPLVRIREALQRDYGIALDRRFTRLLQRLAEGSGDAPRPSAVPTLHAPAGMHAPPRPPSQLPAAPERERKPVRPQPAAGGGPKTLLRAGEVPPPRPQPRRRGPLTADVANQEFDDAAERDTIFDLAFEYARQFFDYTALFTIHGDTAEGRDAYGHGASRDRVARIAVPLDLPSILSMARDQKTTLVKKPSPDGLDAVLVGDLGRRGKTECIVFPIVVRKRVVALLLGDGGEDGVAPSTLTEVKRVIDRAASAFERIIVHRKLGLRGVQASETMSSRASAGDASADGPARRPSVEELAAPIRELMEEPQIHASIAPSSAVAEASSASEAPRGETIVVSPEAMGGAPTQARREMETLPSLPVAPPSSPSLEGASSPAPPKARPSVQRRAEAPALDFSSPRTRPPSDFAPTPVAPPVVDPDATPIAPSVVLTIGDGVDDSPESAAPLPLSVPKVKPAAVSSRLPSHDVRPSSRKPMPASEQAVSVAPRRPPASRSDAARELPSIIVDVAVDYATLVNRVIAGVDEDAEVELLRAGSLAMAAIMDKFPGPMTVERDRLVDATLPRPSECGPVLRLVASQRRTALAPVLTRIEDPSPEKRFWAVYLLSELVYAEAVEPVFQRLFDDEPLVRRGARAAARALAEAFPTAMIERIEAVAKNDSATPFRRTLAIEALGETREPRAVPVLLSLLEDDEPENVAAARTALALVTRQDFGESRAKWDAWWSDNEERHRIEWLIDALMHEHAAFRAASGEELKTITKEYFGYYDDLPKRERERAQARYRDWWNNTGRVRFNRDAARSV